MNNKIRRIENESELVATISKDIRGSDKKSIVFIAGHFPLLYRKESRSVEPNYTGVWGPFPLYSFELSARLAVAAKEMGKEPRLAVIVDDHTYSMHRHGIAVSTCWSKRQRNAFYTSISGKEAVFPGEYGKIMDSYGLSSRNLLRFNHGKVGGEDCLLAS